MGSETFDPGLEAAPAQSADPSTEDRFEAAFSEALGEFDSVEITDESFEAEQDEPTEAVDESADPSVEEAAEVDADPVEETEDLEADTDAESEETTEFSPDSLPPDLRAQYDRKMEDIDKGLNKRLRAIAEKEKQLEAAMFQYQQAFMQMQNQQSVPQQQSLQKPELPGPDATARDWQEYEDRNREYVASQVVDQLRQSGQLADPQQMKVIQQQQEMQQRYYMLVNQPGATDEVMGKMKELAESDERYLAMYDKDDTAVQLFNLAKAQVEREALLKENEELKAKASGAATEEAKRKAGAAKRSTPRPGGAKAVEKKSDFNPKSFASVDDMIDAFRDDFLQDAKSAGRTA